MKVCAKAKEMRPEKIQNTYQQWNNYVETYVEEALPQMQCLNHTAGEVWGQPII